MDKFLNPNGGLRLKGDDLALIQKGHFMGFSALFLAMNNPFFILSGCTISQTATHHVVAPGVIVVDGEYYEVAAQNIPIVAGNIIYWKVVINNASARLFANNTMQYVKEERRIELASAPSIPPNGISTEIPTYRDLLYGKWVSTDIIPLLVLPAGLSLNHNPSWIPFGSINHNKITYKVCGDSIIVNFNISYDIVAGSTTFLHFKLPDGITYPLGTNATGFVEIRNSGTNDYYSSRVEAATLSGQANDRLVIRIPTGLNILNLSISGAITLQIN